ncbi:MAG: hypothetical protein ACD_22C00284G0003 [uncultured bacterium]|nr:MAG: hypothetical protein ACD_22C00284G0003 [uncultured bacterium]
MDDVNKILLDENTSVRKQLAQLENKKQIVSKLKYDALNESFEVMRAENISLRKQLEVVKKDYKQLAEVLTEKQKEIEKLEAIKPTKKDDYKITDYKTKVEELLKTNIKLRDTISQLEQSTINKQGEKSGRKRKSDISDVDIQSMSKAGKSLRTISNETKLSINTIRDILKAVSK